MNATVNSKQEKSAAIDVHHCGPLSLSFGSEPELCFYPAHLTRSVKSMMVFPPSSSSSFMH
ncbi:hypothetical protein RchiOBHm_Chr5g0074581 [Rosa chinensis]|uniref:Uncharacterized protein n=1 Tax=Rosa chinensis TaxID=74649 RepID=A0A2P6QL78_ROSCH|nr:hypothetical protein RchiOBHm_Chr5g0074581 [Rosa chinensis]